MIFAFLLILRYCSKQLKASFAAIIHTINKLLLLYCLFPYKYILYWVDLAKCYVNVALPFIHRSWFSFLFFCLSTLLQLRLPEFRLIVHRHFSFHLFSLSQSRATWKWSEGGKRNPLRLKLYDSHIDIAKTRHFMASTHFYTKFT